MREIVNNGYTPQDKIIAVNNKFGNTGIKNQQGSTVVLYDSLQLVNGKTEYRFFEGSSQRNFPFSNTGADGNKLGVGYSMIVERAYFSIFYKDGADNYLTSTIVGYPGIYIGEFSFEIANSQVLKQFSSLDFNPEFNKSAKFAEHQVVEFDTQINIPPLLEFVAILRTQGLTVSDDFPIYLRLTIEGTGAIIAPRTTF